MFVAMQEAFQPDFYQCLSDGETDMNTGKKRTAKSVERTLKFLDKVLEKVSKSEVLALIYFE